MILPMGCDKENKSENSKQPWPFPFNILKEEWPEVKNAKMSFFLCALAFLILGGTGVWILFEQFVIPGKDATIQNLQTKQLVPQNDLFISQTITNFDGKTIALDYKPVSHSITIYGEEGNPLRMVYMLPPPEVEESVSIDGRTLTFKNGVSSTNQTIVRVDYIKNITE